MTSELVVNVADLHAVDLHVAHLC